ncbi:MAG: hypothetical protein IJ055_07685 [Oscillospiraceae bacterium]|nr:hypothetical protein [Oscillospiraceae bacterium]
MNRSYSQGELEGLLQVVSRKLGMAPEQLRADLEAGKFDRAMQSMDPVQAQKLRQAVRDPQMVERLMSTPQARALYEKLTGGR